MKVARGQYQSDSGGGRSVEDGLRNKRLSVGLSIIRLSFLLKTTQRHLWESSDYGQIAGRFTIV